MLERAQTAVVEICHNFSMRSLRRGRESARSDSNLLDLLDKSWFGPQPAGQPAADGTEARGAGYTAYHVLPRLHLTGTSEPIARACAVTSPTRSSQPRPVSQCGQAAPSGRGDESLAPSVFAMSISLDTVSPLSWASPPRQQIVAAEPPRPTPKSTLTMQIQAEQLLAPTAQEDPSLYTGTSHPDASPCDQLAAAQALAQDCSLIPDLVLDPCLFEGSVADNACQDPARWGIPVDDATLAQPREPLTASPSGYVAPTSQSLIHPQQPDQQLSMPSISMPLLPILMAKPSTHQQQRDACTAASSAVPSLFPVAGSLGASLLFPIAAAAKSMRLRSMQGSESLQGTLRCAGPVSTSAPLFAAPTLASPLGAAAVAPAAAAAAGDGGRAAHAAEQARIQAQLMRQLRSSGLDTSPAPGSCSSSSAAAATAASGGAVGSDRINTFWRGLAAAAAAVDGNNVTTKAGPRVPRAETVIPWTSPMGNGATATADEGMCI